MYNVMRQPLNLDKEWNSRLQHNYATSPLFSPYSALWFLVPKDNHYDYSVSPDKICLLSYLTKEQSEKIKDLSDCFLV